MRSEPRYVLGVADQVPPDGLERRIRRVAELADESTGATGLDIPAGPPIIISIIE